DPASGRTVTDRAHTEARRSLAEATVRSGEGSPTRMDAAVAGEGRRRISGEGHGLSPGDGGTRALRKEMSRVWHGGAAHPLRRERDQLLPEMSDRGPRARGPLAVATAEGRLAAEH